MRNSLSLIAIHGSCLAALGSPPPNDIDVIVGDGSLEKNRHEIEACVRTWAAKNNLPESLPLDIKELDGIPELPFCPYPKFRLLRGELPEKPYRVQYDLAAWIRACERSEEARRMFMMIYANAEGDNPGNRPMHIGFTTATDPNLQTGFSSYQGGGRLAIEAAATKCKAGWEFVTMALDQETREMVRQTTHATSTVIQLMEGFIEMGAPVGTGRCSLVETGVWTAHGRQMRSWAVLAELLRGVQSHRTWLSPKEREILADQLADNPLIDQLQNLHAQLADTRRARRAFEVEVASLAAGRDDLREKLRTVEQEKNKACAAIAHWQQVSGCSTPESLKSWRDMMEGKLDALTRKLSK